MSKNFISNQSVPELESEFENCPGCGAEFPNIDGPTHRYLGASPGCWAIFEEILAKEYGEYGYPPVHRLTVDAYAAQHPGKPSKQSIKSVAVHLISLHLMLDLHYEAQRATKAISRAAQVSQEYVWLEPPASLGELSILDVYQANNVKEHTDRVHIWAHSVWRAWLPHHSTIHRWAEWRD
jgi:hypothetical protein